MSSKKRQKIDEVIFKTQGFETTAIDQTTQNTSSESAAPEAAPNIGLIGLYRAEDRTVSFTGSAITSLSKARTRGTIDKVTRNISIENVAIATTANIGIGEAKLLKFGVGAFSKLNAPNQSNPKLRIIGDTRDFARACLREPERGIDARHMATEAEQRKENRRAAKALENFVAKLGRNAETLKSKTSFSWKETVKGIPKSFSGISLISAYHIDSDVIMLEFSQSAAEYLVQLPLTETPRSVYAIDERKPNAYALAEALIQHYNIENNVMRNTERIISVASLLQSTSFPNQAEIKAKRWSWERVVKEPFEEALEELHRVGLISTWDYSLSGMEILSDEIAYNITRYEQFISLYIYFELSGYSTHTDRVKTILENRAAKEEEAAAKRQKKCRKSYTKSGKNET